MKVLMIVPSFPKLSETFIVSKFVGLINSGLDIHIFCSRSIKKEWAYYPTLIALPKTKNRIHVSWPTSSKLLAIILWLPAFVSCFIQKPFVTLRYFLGGIKEISWNIFKQFYLDREIILVNPDILHFEFGALAVKKEYLKSSLKCRLVTSFRGHDLYFVGLDQTNYYRKLWDTVDSVHFLGEELKKKAISRGFKPSIPNEIIHPSIDIRKFTPSVKKISGLNNKIRILTVGRLHWVKGYEFALQACSELVAQGIEFEYHIAGGGDFLTALSFCSQQFELDAYVTFLGDLAPAKVFEEYCWADIYFHPAVEEGFGNSVIEAQSMGLPVVCSDAVGLPENIEDGVTGFVAPRRDAKSLADKIITLAKSPQLRKRMGSLGRERAIKLYNIDVQIQKFIEFYQKVL